MAALIKARGAAEASVPSQARRVGLTLEQARERVKIDRNALDLAAEEQPELFLQVAEQQVQAISRRDAAKDDLLRIDAKLGRAMRDKAAAEGKKLTEGNVADYVLAEKEHLDASEKAAKLNIEVDEWSALRSALEHRKSMIRELATLFASGYYTAGVASGVGRQQRDAGAAAGREALSRARDERST